MSYPLNRTPRTSPTIVRTCLSAAIELLFCGGTARQILLFLSAHPAL